MRNVQADARRKLVIERMELGDKNEQRLQKAARVSEQRTSVLPSRISTLESDLHRQGLLCAVLKRVYDRLATRNAEMQQALLWQD